MTLLLNGLSEDQQRELLAAGLPRALKPRDVLGAQGEPAESIALVQVGHLKLGQVNADGAETLVRFIGPGDCYGAIALSPGKRFPVSAVAVEPSRVLVWPRAAIAGLAERIPQIRLNLFEEVTRRMGGVLSAVQDLAAERAPLRIARALLRVAEHGGEHSPQGIRIVHPITRQEIADLTGTTLFTVSRVMSRWESDGLLRTGRGAVTIVDPEGLELAASSSDDSKHASRQAIRAGCASATTAAGGTRNLVDRLRMTFFPHTTVGEVAAQFPATVRVFQRRKVEFCCGGHQTLAQVCRDIGTPYEILTVELEHAIRQAPARVTWADRPLSELTDHIAETFHQPLLLELPRLRALITRLQGHGDAHRHLLTVRRAGAARFEAGFLARVTAEASELFPLIDRLEADGPSR